MIGGTGGDRPPTRPAPAISPARAPKPAKKAKPQDDPNYVDLKNLRPGEAFSITAVLDESAYGVRARSTQKSLARALGSRYGRWRSMTYK